MMKWSTKALSLMIALSTAAFSQQEQPGQQPGKPGGNQQNQQQGQDRMQDQRGAQSISGEQRNALQMLVGTWEARGTAMGMESSRDESARGTDGRPTESHTGTDGRNGTNRQDPAGGRESNDQQKTITGTLTSEWALGNNFVKCHLEGDCGGKAIEGIGLTGYDMSKAKYVTTWADNQKMAIMSEEGTYDPASKTFTFTSESKDRAGKQGKYRRTIQFTGNDEYKMTVYVSDEGQAEKKMLEVTCRRSAGAGKPGNER